MLRALGKKLGFGDAVPEAHLPHDPQRLIFDSWLDSARLWFP